MTLDHALYLFNEGRNTQAYRLLGAHLEDGGTTFRVWAPNAARVSVVGDFNGWQPGVHGMHSLGRGGVWEVRVPEAGPGSLYRFAITRRDNGALLVKSDPYARGFELRPGTAAYVVRPSQYVWGDGQWLQQRAAWDWQHAPLNIYEVHAGSWMRHADGRPYLWPELAERLIPYALEQGYTHLELLPITEHPLDESWGYQATGYFAPTSRHGSPDELRAFIDACHQAGLGVLLDWVPGHFPQDDWALARYDGTALYEHEDPRLGLHADWGTHIFNYGRHEVRSFLLSSAHWWLEEFHFDGLRVDAVASMLYLDYSRQPGQWLPNRYGGRENLEAIDFLRELNSMVHGEFPGALTIAEESTDWPQVSRPTYVGGLGFSMKWNMGWMNDSLRYFRRDPVHRRWHHDELTFGQMYAYSENYLLPLSHDEVVHGKGSLSGKMPGDRWQRFANLRLLLAWQAFTPGKKLMFMGGEFGQSREWAEGRELDWGLLADAAHAGVQRLARDLNRLYRDLPALHSQDFAAPGFEWIDCHDSEHSVLSWLRWGRDGSFVVVAVNFTPVPLTGYRIGVPQAGRYVEVLNSDSTHYGGSDLGNGGAIAAVEGEWMRRPANLAITLPPLAAVLLQRVAEDGAAH
ncbi:1,4-alpha-glucan branching protein GlgB [Pseudomonas sp. MAP12]|uniref:1,4-alpha-glucan branching enzyme GlgB n=1 Tax=Geopseudomonas aromaticivorans TaxID=2849492 RepID=A0ABS6N1Z3_9GAMM|nr:1,4-alpha-glucan branching protein GlgB [Pseudomonas aromaticivorans]MBV2135070.1 1,4-alpha-glucan branching protein GlgB [Pseudomonas aromaticivorans]